MSEIEATYRYQRSSDTVGLLTREYIGLLKANYKLRNVFFSYIVFIRFKPQAIVLGGGGQGGAPPAATAHYS